MHVIRPMQTIVKPPVTSTSLGMQSVCIHVYFAVPRAFYQCGTHCKFRIQLVCATEYKHNFVLRETAMGLSFILGAPGTNYLRNARGGSIPNEVVHQPNPESLLTGEYEILRDAMALACANCAIPFASVGVSQDICRRGHWCLRPLNVVIAPSTSFSYTIRRAALI